MIVHLAIVAVLGLASATCYGASYVIEQRKASQAPEETAMRLSLLWHLARQPMWWVAILVDVGGFGFQAWALGLGELVFVQPLLVLSLPISLAIGHWAGSHRLQRSDLGWSAVFVVALGVFLASVDPGSGVASRPFAAWLWPLVGTGVVVVGCVVLSYGATPAKRALLLGLAAGILFGLASPLTKSFSALLGSHGLGVLGHWETYALVAAALTGMLVMSSAFQAGDLRAALPSIELGEPVIAVVFGVTLYREQLQIKNPLMAAVVVTSIIAMVVAALCLARSAASDEPRAETTGTE